MDETIIQRMIKRDMEAASVTIKRVTRQMVRDAIKRQCSCVSGNYSKWCKIHGWK